MITNLNKATFPGVALPVSDSYITATTGSPTTGTFTDTGVNYKYYSFTGSGSITLSKAGLVDIILVGGGGGTVSSGNALHRSGGGGGGALTSLSLYVAVGSTTITIGAGGAGGATPTTGGVTKFGSIVSFGGAEGGGRANTVQAAVNYACGGGGGNNGGLGGVGFVGFNGATAPAGDTHQAVAVAWVATHQPQLVA